ncbi:hypothetical protein [Vibrio salinus]|uniref:hypothetical protein n=1 Tax=Vibrio salinus TaxID=2899784 RepID=UPI001E292C97|nr:hypothetical protein [Vibrio salinus]MCE0492387.1 hypothetical protein [Vibrio salinus]
MLKIIQRKRQQYVLLFTVIYFCISIFFVEFVTGLFIQNQVEADKDEIRYQIALIRSRIEATIYRDTYLAESVATLVTIAPDFCNHELV